MYILQICFALLVVSARLKKVEQSIDQQKELHMLQIQREQLQIKALQEELSRKSEHHSFQLEREREVNEKILVFEIFQYLVNFSDSWDYFSLSSTNCA